MIVASDRSLARKLVDKITNANREYIASVEAKIGENNGESIIGSTSELNRVLEVLKTRTRRNNSNNALDSQGRANSDNGGVSVGESESDGIGYSQKGNGNKRSVKFALKDTVELQTDSRESQDNQGGVLGKNADNRRISNAIIFRPRRRCTIQFVYIQGRRTSVSRFQTSISSLRKKIQPTADDMHLR